MAHYNPHVVGHDPLYNINNQVFFSLFHSISASYDTIFVRHPCINMLCTVGSKALSNHVSQTLDTYASHFEPKSSKLS